jgi:hypothetical protein
MAYQDAQSKVLIEQECSKANTAAKSQKTELEVCREELSRLLSQAKANEALVERVPRAITAFEEAFQNFDLRQQKAQLQTILKAAHIYNDGKIELEFRGESG